MDRLLLSRTGVPILWRFLLMPFMMWLFMFADAPGVAAQQSISENTTTAITDIKVLKDTLLILRGQYVYLNNLIENGVVEGIDLSEWRDYKPSCDNRNVTCSQLGFYTSTYEVFNVTYTNTKDPEVKFELQVQALNSLYNRLNGKSVLIEGNVRKEAFYYTTDMPLSEYEFIRLAAANDGDPDSILKLEVDKVSNTIILEGLKPGNVYLQFKHPYMTKMDMILLHVGEKTSNIKIKSDTYFFPYINLPISLITLVEAGEIDGITLEESKKYVPSCDDSSLRIRSHITNGYAVTPTEYQDYTVYYTHEEDSAKQFCIKYSIQKCFDILIAYNARPVTVGETKTVYLTDEYLPLSAYTSFSIGPLEGYDPESIADIDIDIPNNKISITGKKEGSVSLYINLPALNGNRNTRYMISVIVAERPTVEEEPEVDENGEGEILSGLNQKVKIVVPKEIAEAASDLPLIWKSSNEDIASIDENVIVNPSALGRTIITASIENTASRSAETVLMTIEFWVTELVADVPETLAVGSTAQASYTVDAGADNYTKSINAEWESSDPTVVEIDNDGNITAMAEGQATITLTTDIGTKTAVVTVEAAGSEPETLSISPADVGITVGNKLKLSAQGANGREVVWTTSNSFAVQVDGDGWLTAIAPGSATVTATIAGTSIRASVYVTVFERTTGIEETEISEPRIAVEGNTVNVDGIAADMAVEVYNVAGRLIATRKGSCSIAIDQSGIYLVRVGNLVRKVAVKR